ncbi:GNAT family N-acetyltransferase [Capnocytophaga sp. ARDL2]|uniref:GNAT family N-acetyltransferase n=1 Tax=Capnocytophaga sp. ARDL2 TaxID=3238809 RepID=UPI00355844CC
MIRFAKPEDAEEVAPLMFQAMEDIVYKIIGKNNKNEGILFLKQLFESENNQYSYQNAIVYVENEKILGSIVFYDGGKLISLRKPVLDLAEQRFGNKVQMEDETQTGETYIDTLSVAPQTQGKGIGTKLLHYLINYVQQHQLPKLTLLVDTTNPNAKKLYSRLGFVEVGEQTLAGGTYLQMVYRK